MSLQESLIAIKADKIKFIRKLQRDEMICHKLRREILDLSRSNFLLERDLESLEEKIKLIIKNQQKMELTFNPGRKIPEKGDGSGGGLLGDQHEDFVEFCYLLQNHPEYLGRACKYLSGKDVPGFIQIVIFDLYGDQYDTREERLLLQLFQEALRAELEGAQDQGSLFRANTATTKLLTAYSRRGRGVTVLQQVLGPPLKKLCRSMDLDLEIHPISIYRQLCQQRNQEPDKMVDDDMAAQIPEIQAIVASRVQQLLDAGDEVLNAVMASIEQIPYGMRWICSKLQSECLRRFPEATRYEVGSLVGGYIMLRFFTPAVVAPDTNNIIQSKPTKIQRRNFVLIAKLIQNLSNGVLFGDKEQFMKVCNAWVEARRDPLQEFFDRLVEINNLASAGQMDEFLEYASSRQHLRLSVNQIRLLHQLCGDNQDHLAPPNTPNDPLRQVLRRLGTPKPQVDKDLDEMCALDFSRLTQKKQQFMDPHQLQSQTTEISPLYTQTRNVLFQIIQRLPTPIANYRCFMDFLDACEAQARHDLQHGEQQLSAVADPFMLQDSRSPSAEELVPMPPAALRLTNLQNLRQMLQALVDLQIIQAARPHHPASQAASADESKDDSADGSRLSRAMAVLEDEDELPENAHLNPSWKLSVVLASGAPRVGQADTERIVDDMISALGRECQNRVKKMKQMKHHMNVILEAHGSIQGYKEHLTAKLDAYKLYLDNIRVGQHQRGRQVGLGRKTRVTKLAADFCVRLSHEQMIKRNALIRFKAEEVPKRALKYCSYMFRRLDSTSFSLTLQFKKGSGIGEKYPALLQPLKINIEKLLDLQAKQQQYIDVDFLCLHVDRLVDLFNTEL